MSDRDLFSLSEDEEEGEGEAAAAVLAACGQEEEEVEHGTASQRKCSECKQVYVEAGQNSKKALYLLAIGTLDNNGNHLFSFNNEPWSELPKTTMRPLNNEYLEEINRRAALFNIIPRPHADNWKRSRIMQCWLHDNPVRESDCKAFLVAEVTKLRDTLDRMNKQAAESAELGTANWRGSIPYLRVIMSLTDDNVKRLYINRAMQRLDRK